MRAPVPQISLSKARRPVLPRRTYDIDLAVVGGNAGDADQEPEGGQL